MQTQTAMAQDLTGAARSTVNTHLVVRFSAHDPAVTSNDVRRRVGYFSHFDFPSCGCVQAPALSSKRSAQELPKFDSQASWPPLACDCRVQLYENLRADHCRPILCMWGVLWLWCLGGGCAARRKASARNTGGCGIATEPRVSSEHMVGPAARAIKPSRRWRCS